MDKDIILIYGFSSVYKILQRSQAEVKTDLKQRDQVASRSPHHALRCPEWGVGLCAMHRDMWMAEGFSLCHRGHGCLVRAVHSPQMSVYVQRWEVMKAKW